MTPFDRVTIRCSHCDLNQFLRAGKRCARCRKLLFDLPVMEPVPDPIPVVRHGGRKNPELASWVGRKVLSIRTGKRMSQRILAKRAHVPRTYISKVETGHITPNTASIEHLAAGLGVTAFDLLNEEKIELDPFIRELQACVHNLSESQLRSVLIAAQQLWQGNRGKIDLSRVTADTVI